MKLLWILYKGKKRTRYILLLRLGTKDSKTVGLDAQLVDDASRSKIQSSREFINLSLYAKLNWLKKYCSNVMKAYKELDENRIISSQEFDINSK